MGGYFSCLFSGINGWPCRRKCLLWRDLVTTFKKNANLACAIIGFGVHMIWTIRMQIVESRPRSVKLLGSFECNNCFNNHLKWIDSILLSLFVYSFSANSGYKWILFSANGSCHPLMNVFLLFLQCFYTDVWLFILHKMCQDFSAIFSFTKGNG